MRLTVLTLTALLAGPAVAADCDNATSQLALSQCADAQFREADAALNAAYQQIVGRLETSPDTSQPCARPSAPGWTSATGSARSPRRRRRKAASTR